MGKILVLIAVLVGVTCPVAWAGESAPAHELTKQEAHQLLCEAAARTYTAVFKDVKSCLEATTVEDGDQTGFFQIEFASCDSGEYIYLEIDPATKEVLDGSVGIEPDMCE